MSVANIISLLGGGGGCTDDLVLALLRLLFTSYLSHKADVNLIISTQRVTKLGTL